MKHASKRRVLWVNGCPSLGGGEIAQIAIFREIGRSFDVKAVLPDDAWGSLQSEVTSIGAPYWSMPLKRFERTLRPDRLARTAWELISRIRFLVRLIRAEKIDLVHAGYLFDLPYCTAAAKICRVPVVWLIENPERFDRFNRTVITACRLDAAVGTSSAILREGLEAGMKAGITAVAGNPYNDAVFVAADRPRSAPGTVVIGFAGVFGERKGVIELCRAYSEISRKAKSVGRIRTELHLVGGGKPEYEQQMRSVLAEAGVLDETKFLGQVKTAAEMYEFYRSLDIYVMLSKREGMSVAMMEAMASGLPCAILSPWGDDAVIDGLTGVRLATDRPNDVADAIWPLVESPELRARLSAGAVAHLQQNYSPAAVATKLQHVYEQLLSDV